MYSAPWLKRGESKRTKKGLKSADDEFERRNVVRESYQELSRYYRPRSGKEWRRPSLLREGKHKHDHSTFRHSTYPKPSQC